VHVKAILRKLQINNRTQAAIWAIDNGVIVGGSTRASLGSKSSTIDVEVPVNSPQTGSDRMNGHTLEPLPLKNLRQEEKTHAQSGMREYLNGQKTTLERMAQLRAERLELEAAG
jgi:hypothetical protein